MVILLVFNQRNGLGLMYYEKVELCGVNTSTLKVLSTEEKRELLLLAQKGDFDARDRLMYGNLRLVFDAFFVSVVLFIVFCIYSLFLRKLCVKSAKALF